MPCARRSGMAARVRPRDPRRRLGLPVEPVGASRPVAVSGWSSPAARWATGPEVRTREVDGGVASACTNGATSAGSAANTASDHSGRTSARRTPAAAPTPARGAAAGRSRWCAAVLTRRARSPRRPPAGRREPSWSGLVTGGAVDVVGTAVLDGTDVDAGAPWSTRRAEGPTPPPPLQHRAARCAD